MKRIWKTGEAISSIHNIEDSEIGQLLTYMVGHYVQAIANGNSDIVPMLGLYVEASQVSWMNRLYTLLCWAEP